MGVYIHTPRRRRFLAEWQPRKEYGVVTAVAACLRVNVCMCVCIYVCVCVYVYMCMYVCVHTHTLPHRHLFMEWQPHKEYEAVMAIAACLPVYVSMYVCMYVCVYVYA